MKTKSMKVHAETHDALREIAKRLKVPMTVLMGAMTRKARASRNLRISLAGYLDKGTK